MDGVFDGGAVTEGEVELRVDGVFESDVIAEGEFENRAVPLELSLADELGNGTLEPEFFGTGIAVTSSEGQIGTGTAVKTLVADGDEVIEDVTDVMGSEMIARDAVALDDSVGDAIPDTTGIGIAVISPVGTGGIGTAVKTFVADGDAPVICFP